MPIYFQSNAIYSKIYPKRFILNEMIPIMSIKNIEINYSKYCEKPFTIGWVCHLI